MKQGKNPTRKQKILISKKKLIPENWVVIRETNNGLEIRHKETGTLKVIQVSINPSTKKGVNLNTVDTRAAGFRMCCEG